MRDAIHRRRWRDDQSGMSLVEIMIAVFVLSVGLLALASTAITSIVNIRVSRGRQEATDAASAMIEDLRRSDFTAIALDEFGPGMSEYLAEHGGCDPDHDEPLVLTNQPGGLLREQTFGPSGRVTLYTSVSWYDDPDNGLLGCADGAHDKRVKRVRVVAEWTDKDRTFTLEETTLVSDVDRGLPAPDFRLSPGSGSLDFTPDDQAAEPPVEKCIPHLLRNLGAEDGYDWFPEKVGGTSGEPTKQDTPTIRFHTASEKWTIRTFMEFPPADPPANPADAVPHDHPNRQVTVIDNMELLRDDDGNFRPETDPDTRLAAGDAAILWVCYRAGDQLSVGDFAEFEINVQSLFDENRVETVTHTVRVTSTEMDWFLYDDDESLEGADGPRLTGGNQRPATLRMGPLSDGQPEQLGHAAAMPDYDTDLDPHGLPGTRLAPTDDHASANTIVFHEQVTSDTTFEPSVDLAFYTAAESGLLDGSDNDPTLNYRIQLKLLNSNENENQATTIQINGADQYDYSYPHTAVGWMLYSETLTINGGAPLAVAEGQYLRLEITCLDSVDVCHLGYDHVHFPSVLGLVVAS